MIPEKLLSGMLRPQPIEVLLDGRPADLNAPEERRLLSLVVPPWQRPEVWSEAQKTRFIEGIFLGLGTGEYVVNGRDYSADGKDKPCSGWLLDGQQRITAIRDFVEGRLPIFGNVHFDDLDIGTKRRRFLHVVFPRHELSYTADERVLMEIYDRLNFGGTPHDISQRPDPDRDAAFRPR